MIETSWTPKAYIKDKIDSIRNRIGSNYVLCLINYDLNSAILAYILKEALGEQVLFVFIDTGLNSINEKEKAVELFEKNLKIKIIKVKSHETFLTNLSLANGIQEQMTCIVDTFINTLSKVIYEAGVPIYCISDGTSFNSFYNENKENYSKYMEAIRSLNVLILQPMRNLDKSQLIQLGNYLALPADVIDTNWSSIYGRTTFMEGNITRSRLEVVNKIQEIYQSEMHKNNFSKFNTTCIVNFLNDQDTFTNKFQIALKAIDLVQKDDNTNVLNLSTTFWKNLSNQIKHRIPNINEIFVDLN